MGQSTGLAKGVEARQRRAAQGKRGAQGQVALSFRRWGGARAGAGRHPNGDVAGVGHLRRPALSRQHPVHVTLKVGRGVSSLRGRGLFERVQRALARGQERFGFRLVHFSVQRDHLHLIAEAHDRRALSRGVQGLSIRVARAVNSHLGRHGRVFAERYHARALMTPRAARFALRYVLLNARKHERGRGAVPFGFVDPCSSGAWFDGFAQPSNERRGVARPAALTFGVREARSSFARSEVRAAPVRAAPVVGARTWLLRVGWRRAGPLDVDDAPKQ